jgi:hypothetical protein
MAFKPLRLIWKSPFALSRKREFEEAIKPCLQNE